MLLSYFFYKPIRSLLPNSTDQHYEIIKSVTLFKAEWEKKKKNTATILGKKKKTKKNSALMTHGHLDLHLQRNPEQ